MAIDATETQALPAPLDYWRSRALAQADELNAHDATIRDLIRETNSYALIKACPDHGHELTALWEELAELEVEVERANQARIVFAMACNYLEFLRPDQLARVTPEALHSWAGKHLDMAERARQGLSELVPVSLVKRHRRVPRRIVWGPHPRPHDRRETVEYWEHIALRQSETIAKHPEILARYTKERNEAIARNSSCTLHEELTSDTKQHVKRKSSELERNDKSREYLTKWFAKLLETSKTEVPAKLPTMAKGINARAHKIWNP